MTRVNGSFRSSTKINVTPQLTRTTSFYLVSLGRYGQWRLTRHSARSSALAVQSITGGRQWLWWDRERQAGNCISWWSSSGQVDTWALPVLSSEPGEHEFRWGEGVSLWIWRLSGAEVEQDRWESTDWTYAISEPASLPSTGKENTWQSWKCTDWNPWVAFWNRSF